MDEITLRDELAEAARMTPSDAGEAMEEAFPGRGVEAETIMVGTYGQDGGAAVAFGLALGMKLAELRRGR